MNRYLKVVKRVASIAAEGDFKQTWTVVSNWIHSEEYNYGVYRDTRVPFSAPKSKFDFTIRPIQPKDAKIIFGKKLEEANSVDKFLLLRRQEFYEQNIPTCYVAVTDDEPLYFEWLITSDYNDFIQDYFGGYFPILQPNEAILEMAFTFPKFRRQHVLSESLGRIAKIASEQGIERLVSFIGIENIGSLKGYKNAGFIPYTYGIEKWSLFRRSTEYVPLPEKGLNLDIFPSKGVPKLVE